MNDLGAILTKNPFEIEILHIQRPAYFTGGIPQRQLIHLHHQPVDVKAQVFALEPD